MTFPVILDAAGPHVLWVPCQKRVLFLPPGPWPASHCGTHVYSSRARNIGCQDRNQPRTPTGLFTYDVDMYRRVPVHSMRRIISHVLRPKALFLPIFRKQLSPPVFFFFLGKQIPKVAQPQGVPDRGRNSTPVHVKTRPGQPHSPMQAFMQARGSIPVGMQRRLGRRHSSPCMAGRTRSAIQPLGWCVSEYAQLRVFSNMILLYDQHSFGS